MWTEDRYEAFVDMMHTKYPKMFAEPYGGFAIGPGWWKIIEVLCANIQSHIDWQNMQKEKFNRGNGCPQVVVRQIKEKFGGLRFYYDGGNEYISGLVSGAESWAESACEECGAPGEKRGGGWIKTLCDFHHEENVKAKQQRINHE
jgi:hypothetical protein